MTAVKNWKQQYADEVRRNILEYEERNKNAKTVTRKMTEEEYQDAFGKKRESCHKLKINRG